MGTETETTFYWEICSAKKCNPEHTVCLSWLVEHTDSFYRYIYILNRNWKNSHTENFIYTYFCSKMFILWTSKRYKHMKSLSESVCLGTTLLYWLRIFSCVFSVYHYTRREAIIEWIDLRICDRGGAMGSASFCVVNGNKRKRRVCQKMDAQRREKPLVLILYVADDNPGCFRKS